MKSLILMLLSGLFLLSVMLGACATEDLDLDETEQGLCIVYVCDEYGCFNEIRGCGPSTGGPSGPPGGGGFGEAGPSSSWACQNQIGCYTEQVTTGVGQGGLTCAVIGEVSACGNPRAQVCGIWSTNLWVTKCGTDICSSFLVPNFYDTLCGNTGASSYGGLLNGNCAGYESGTGCVGEIPPPPAPPAPPPPSGGGQGGGSGGRPPVEQGAPTETQ